MYKIILVAGLAAIAGAYGAHALRHSDAKECLDVYQEYFNDPKSADIIEAKRQGSMLEVDFTIANRMGGRSRETVECDLNPDGKVDRILSAATAALWAFDRSR